MDTQLAPEIKLTELPYGGYRVKTAGRVHIEVWPMIFNWRITTTPVDCPLTHERHWCYKGTGPGSFMATVLAAWAWDGSDDSEPEGWNKNGQTQEWRDDPA